MCAVVTEYTVLVELRCVQRIKLYVPVLGIEEVDRSEDLLVDIPNVV